MGSKEIARKRIVSLIEETYETYKEFEDSLGLKRNTVTEWKRGVSTFLEILPEIADALGVTTDYLLGHKSAEKNKTVPVIGRIQAGYPIESYEGTYGEIRILDDEKPNTELFALEVVGDSMMPIVMEGDIIICERTEPNRANGKICVVTIDGESTLKKLKADSSGVTLIPLNPLYKEIHYTKHEVITKDFKVNGVVIESIRKFE